MATLANILDRFSAPKSFEVEAPRPRFSQQEDPYAVPAFPNEDVYLYVKRINNSRVARESDPASYRMCWRMIAGVIVAAMLLIGVLLPTVYGLMAGYRLEALRHEKQRLELDRAALELQESKLMTPARLEELARMQRFVDPAPENVVYLEDKSTDQILARK